MKNRLYSLLLAVLLCPPLLSAQSVTIGAQRVLDVDTGRWIDNVIVRIEKGRIVSVQGRTASDRPSIDLPDVSLVPGLTDCHVHLIGGEGLTPYESLRQTTARAAIEGVANAKKTLLAGFTTARDLGAENFADVALRDAIRAGSVPGPRLLVAIRGISPTGGHGDRNDLPLGVEVHGFSSIADGPEEIRKKVREEIKYGADWIKILATGGVMSAGTDPRQSEYTEEELRAAVSAAREKGRDVAAHAHGTTGIIRAARAGVRSIEHSSMLDDEAIEAIRAAGTFVVPNPYTNRFMIETGEKGGYTDYQLSKSRDVYTLKMNSLKRAIKAGIPIAYGTDAGVQVHGVNGRQFALFIEAGMTPLAAIQSATIVAARLLRMEKDIGRIAEGYYGDLVGVRGDPLSDVRVLENPVFVMKEGVEYLRK